MFSLDVARIRTMLFERNLSLAEFARQARINQVTARKVVTDGTTATAKVINSLAKFFGVDGNALILKGAD